MITHVVLFKFDDLDHAKEAVSKLKNMKGQVEGLDQVEAGLDVTRSPRSYEVGLITRHQDVQALNTYRNDPHHLSVAEFIGKHSSGAAACDFES